MESFKIWLARHPESPEHYEIKFTQPYGYDDGVWIEPYVDNLIGQWCEWKEHLCIPVES